MIKQIQKLILAFGIVFAGAFIALILLGMEYRLFLHGTIASGLGMVLCILWYKQLGRHKSK